MGHHGARRAITIDELNTCPAEHARAALRPCADVDSWVDALVAGRPYADADDLLDRAVGLAARWSDSEVEHALRDHPRIGESPTGDGGAAAHSRREQASMATADEGVAARIADGNQRYEQRFGRVYLVRAAGRTPEELLNLLEERLGNDDDVERAETKAQLAEIAVLRLRALVTGDGA